MIKEYVVKSEMLDRKRKVFIDQNYIEFENKDLKGGEFTRFYKSEITDLKYGVEWIVWYKFYVGRHFTITLRNRESKELRLGLKGYFRFGDEYEKIYSSLINDIWKYFYQDIFDAYLNRFHANEDLIIGRLKLSPKGIDVLETGLNFTWTNLSLKAYPTYFSLSRIDAPEFHIWINFNEWNSEAVYILIQRILKDYQTNS
ncbi:MAG TPA: hypothetical protein PLJ60_21640 [Chryseolinea sp.]|nr:hypothetical protein [Chryseolinea sp.]HPM32951.1 hypothetical protein [Chryseolinea sp.]